MNKIEKFFKEFKIQLLMTIDEILNHFSYYRAEIKDPEIYKTIAIKGEVRYISNPELSREMDGFVDDNPNNDFVEYMDNNQNFVKGTLSFEYDFLEEKLYSIVTYKYLKDLKYLEVEDLVEYTIGQLYDGIGEGFEQFPINVGKEPLFVSPGYPKKEAYLILI